MSSDKLDKKMKKSKNIDSDIDLNTYNKNDINGTINSSDNHINVDNKVDNHSQLTGDSSPLNDERQVKGDSLFANMKLSNPIKGKSFGSIVDFASIGLLLVSSVFVGATMGYFLDQKFGTKPYLSLIFLILGLISGVKSVYKILKKTGMMNGQK